MKVHTYQIKDVADIAGVSPRTLRHYDELGLLTPSHRSAAGYRLYTDEDLLRLQQILIGRSLGLALEVIRKTLDDPHLDRKALLLQQREALVARAQATSDMIRSIDAAIALMDFETTQENAPMNATHIDMKAIFNGFDPAQYEDEVRQRWGGTEAYKESARRTRNYTEDDWRRIKKESNDILTDAATLMRTNSQPDDVQSMEIAERYRHWIDRWFYPCEPSMHGALADMYQCDPRFSKYFDDYAPGLAQFLSAAIRANSKRHRSAQ